MLPNKSLEALERLCKVKIYQREASAYDYLGKEIYKEEFETIKQDLERLEVLEKENKKAQTYFIEAQKILNKDINNLLTENASLKKGIETLTIKNNLLQEDCDSIADTNVLLSKGIENLTKENQDLKDNENIVCDYAYQLKEENEKLKKVIKENFMYIPDALFEKVCFKWTGPVMENEIIEVLNND